MDQKDYTSVRGVSDRMGEHKDCAVIAVALTCKVSYEKAHAALKACGRRDRSGTPFNVTEAAVRKLGYKINRYKRMRQAGGSRYTPKTIGGRLRKGRYLCRVRGHIFAVVDGQVMDWTAGRNHRIEHFYRVTKVRVPRDTVDSSPTT